jgi:hypothetical protein
VATLRCPRCLALLPEKAARCSVCGADPAQPVADGGAPVTLLPQIAPSAAAGAVARSPGWWLPGAAILALVAVALAALFGMARLAADAGFSAEAWPALVGMLVVAALAALVLGERRRRKLNRLDLSRSGGTNMATDLGLVHLFADRFAAPASGPDSFRPPLQQQHVGADEAAWRAVAATLLDLAEQDVIELEPHALPTATEPVQVVAVRVVRPLPHDDAFAALLLRPLTRRGVGASTTVSELVGQALMADRHPGRTLLDSARAPLATAGYYRPTGSAGTGNGPLPMAWARATLLRPLEPDPHKIEAARSQMEALQARLAAWDARDPSLAPTLRHEVLAAFVRARARAGARAGQ